jgi:fatty acid desaturase
MTRPLSSAKQTVDLASTGPRVSKIRRDPPPKLKEIEIRDPKERDRSDVIVGVIVFALALFVIVLAAASYAGWSPAQYTVELK